MSSKSTISFIVPVYNSSSSLEELSMLIIKATEKHSYLCEILYVNDGSDDDSFQKISELCDRFPKIIKGIDLMRNFGQHNATLCGFENSKGDYVVSIDDDLSFQPEQAFDLLKELKDKNLDFIYGIPEKASHSLRRALGKQFMFWGSSIGSKKIAGASFRLLTKNIVDQISYLGDVVFIDDVLTQISINYSYLKLKAQKAKIKSRYNSKKLLKSGFNILFFYSGFPLRLISLLGIIGSCTSGFIGLYFIIKKIFFHAPTGYTSIIVAILFSTSALLLGIGILGEYIHRMYKNKHQTKAYYIREIKDKT